MDLKSILGGSSNVEPVPVVISGGGGGGPSDVKLIDSSITLPVSVSSAVPLAVTQATTPWDVKVSESVPIDAKITGASVTVPVSIASNIGVTQATTPWDVKVSESVPIDAKITSSAVTLPVAVTNSVGVTQAAGPFDVKLTSSSTTLPVSIASNVGVTQATSPWDVKVSQSVPIDAKITAVTTTVPVSIASNVGVTQASTPWEIKATETISVSVPDPVAVLQATSPWGVVATADIPVRQSVVSDPWNVAVSGSVPVTQSTTPWDCKVTQSTTPWDCKISQSSTIPVSQAVAPFDVRVTGATVTLPVSGSTSGSFPTTAFSELLCAEPVPVVQSSFLYNKINSQQFLTFTGVNASFTFASNVVTLNAGASTSSYALIRSRRSIRYRPGQGAELRFTTIFGTGNADFYKLSGMGTLSSGLYFGYRGSVFGIMRFFGGVQHIVSLTITGAATGAEIATITLNGQAFNVNLTNASGNANFTAYQIARLTTYTGWSAVENVANVVYFVADFPGPKGGSYTFTSATATGTFQTLNVGVAASEDWIPQTSWNRDKMDGKGVSGQILDVTKGNVYRIFYQHLGFGTLTFQIENAVTGEFQTVHDIQYANSNIIPSLFVPSLAPLWAVVNVTGNNSTTSMQACCVSGHIQGFIRRLDPRGAFYAERSIAAATETNVIVLKNRIYYNFLNLSEVFIQSISVAAEGTRNCVFNIYLTNQTSGIGNNTTAGFAEYKDVQNGESLVVSDVRSSTFSNCTLILSVVVAQNSNTILDLIPFNLQISRDQALLVTARSAASTNVSVGISWVEEL